MNKREYLQGMHQIYQEIYSQYGDKESYRFAEGIEIVQLSLKHFPKVFNIEPNAYEAAMPEIFRRSIEIFKEGMSIDKLLLGISIFVLKHTGVVTRFFPFRVIFWGLTGSLQIAPKRLKNG